MPHSPPHATATAAAAPAPDTPPPAAPRPLPPSSPASPSPDASPNNHTLPDAIRANLLGPSAADFSDVTFTTPCDTRVPACRTLLAIRSPYFRNLFFLPFAERSKPDVPIDLPPGALRQVIHFAYTDTCPLLDRAAAAVAEASAPKPKCVASDPPTPSPPPTHGPLVAAVAAAVARRKSGSGEPPRKRRAVSSTAPPPVHSLVELLRAADYVALPALAARAHHAVIQLARVHPPSACAAFEAARAELDGASEKLVKNLAMLIRRFPQQALGVPDLRDHLPPSKGSGSASAKQAPVPVPAALSDPAPGATMTPAPASTTAELQPDTDDNGAAVLKLSEDSLDAILADKDLFAGETYLFQALFYWATRQTMVAMKRPVQPDDPVLVRARLDAPRWAAAKRLVAHIDLERMKPSFLVDYVQPCGLIEDECVYKAFMRQALEAERGRALFDNFRGGSGWPGVDGKVLQLPLGAPSNHVLDTPWVTAGKHEWSFKITRSAPDIWLGFARSKPPDNGRRFFEMGRGWAFSTGGAVQPDTGNEVVKTTGGAPTTGPLVWEGAVVKIILNLLKSGTFTVMVDDCPKSFLAFRELKARSKRFIPVVCAAAPAEIELVGEKHLV